jgi:hypothetical protein
VESAWKIYRPDQEEKSGKFAELENHEEISEEVLPDDLPEILKIVDETK